jgi:hypothetical protein
MRKFNERMSPSCRVGGGQGAAEPQAMLPRYESPQGHWVCLASALRAGQPSGNTDFGGIRIRTGSRPPPPKQGSQSD